VDLMIQLVDRAGNVGISSNKGPGYRSAAPVASGGAPQLSTNPPIVGGFVRTEPVITLNGTGPFELVVDGVVQPFGGSYTVRGQGAHSVVARDLSNGSSTSVSFFTDSVAPGITITAPTARSYMAGRVPPPTFACTDPGPASGVQPGACVQQGYGTAVGSHTMVVTGTDAAGNVGTAQVTYTVSQTYSFDGFYAPVDNPPVVNKVKAGSTVPVKFRLLDSTNAEVTDPSKIKSVTSSAIACSASAATDQIEEVAPATAPAGLTYDAVNQQFQYNWRTDKVWAGTCRRLVVTAVDGTTRAALFQLTK
jgi:hypothetical protein